MTLTLFVLYLIATVGIGLWAARGGHDGEEGFFLAGRGLSPFVVALSAVSSGRSAWLVLGASGAAWSLGLSAVWLFPGYIAAEGLLLWKLGPRLRERSAAQGAITVPEVLAGLAAGGRASRWPVRQVAGVIVVAFLVTYVSAQLVAGGKALEAIFPEVDGRTAGLAATAGIVLVYTLLGGYRAVAMTDVVQGLLMLAGLVILPVLAVLHVGGPSAVADALRAIDPALLDWSSGWKAALAGVAIGLGSFGSPPILVRVLSIDSATGLRRAAVIGTTWNVVMAGGALVIGLAGRAIFTGADAFPGGDREHLYPLLGELLASEYLFPGFVGILLAALFAAIMSTCDSQLLVIASSFVRDFRGAGSGAGAAAGGVGKSRLAVLLALLAAVAIGYGAEHSVKDFVLFSWDALGAAFGPAILFLVLCRRVRPGAVLLSMLVGVATTVLWGKTPDLAALIHQRVPGFFAAVFILLGSLALPAPRD